MPLVEIKDFNALISNKPFFDQTIKKKQETYKKLVKMSRNDDYKIGNLLDYLHHQNCYTIITINLSRQQNIRIPRKNNMVRKYEEDDGAIIFFI